LEISKIWTNDAFSGVELLSASYTKFEFSKHWRDELAIGIIEEGAEGLGTCDQVELRALTF
jgi:hypothetical protein